MNKDLTEKELFSMEDDSTQIPQESMEEIEKEMEMELDPDVEEMSDDENGMELELDDETLEDMEEIIQDKVAKEAAENKKKKSKPGPKGPRKEKTDEEKKASKPKKTTAEELKSSLERNIKKGIICAPQGRIEKLDDGNYRMLLAEAVGTREDVGPHAEWTHVDDIKVMHHGKFILTEYAADKFGFPFQHQTDDGEVIEHNFVRVELHKPGREKDVIELFKVDEAKRRIDELNKREQRKEEEAKKKAEKAENEEKEVESKEESA